MNSNRRIPLIECDKVSKNYRDGQSTLSVVHEVSFKLYEEESIAIVGALSLIHI